MSLNLPIRSTPTSRRNKESRNYFTNYTPASAVGAGSGAGTEAINGPVREPAREPKPAADRLIVGVDFGTTFSGCVFPYLFILLLFLRPLNLSFLCGIVRVRDSHHGLPVVVEV